MYVLRLSRLIESHLLWHLEYCTARVAAVNFLSLALVANSKVLVELLKRSTVLHQSRVTAVSRTVNTIEQLQIFLSPLTTFMFLTRKMHKCKFAQFFRGVS